VTKIDGETHGFFTMEFVQGGTLDKYRSMRGEDPLPIAESLDIVRQTALGLSVAHSEQPPIIHRDIKPQNILVSSEDVRPRVRLGDFGLAKQANPMTLMLSARGTLSYKAPEAFSNSDSSAGDIWALGCVLYYLLADRHPFPRASKEGEIAKKSDIETYRPPSRFNISVDDQLDSLVRDCLTYSHEDRIQDASSLIGRIDLLNDPTSVLNSSRNRPKTVESDATASKSFRDDPELKQIFEYAKKPQNLYHAAEMLERWIERNPDASNYYESFTSLWKKGISQ
jgi:serine/threonine-protein kinase